MKEVLCIISGRVQLVLFRDFVQRKACSLELKGTVRNLSNGKVEVVAQGSKEKLEKLIQYLHQGSLLSRVDKVEVDWKEPTKIFDNFRIVYF